MAEIESTADCREDCYTEHKSKTDQAIEKIDVFHISKYRTELMGLAILWIMLYHCREVDIPIIRQIQEVGYSGVEIFFLLSSFGLLYAWEKRKSVKEFYLRRARRILPYYLPIVVGRCIWFGLFEGGGV